MAPVPASLSSGPSWVSTLTFSIGDKKQIIVYTAILVSFIALFVIGLVYVLRVYNASSSEDEESRDTSTPRPPLRLAKFMRLVVRIDPSTPFHACASR